MSYIPNDRERALLDLHFDISTTPGSICDPLYFGMDGRISVAGTVRLKKTSVTTKFPVRFGRVENFSLDSNKWIESLEGCPSRVDGFFDCTNTKITSLVGGPETVGDNFFCHETLIRNLHGAPKEVGGVFSCFHTPILNLLDCPKSGRVLLCPRDIPLLQVCYLDYRTIEAACRDELDWRLTRILKKYLGRGHAGILPLATELIAAGYRNQAQL